MSQKINICVLSIIKLFHLWWTICFVLKIEEIESENEWSFSKYFKLTGFVSYAFT